MTAKPKNYGMIQLAYREIDEEEPLSSWDLYGVTLWLDSDRKIVLIDVPPGYSSSVIGSEPDDLDVL